MPFEHEYKNRAIADILSHIADSGEIADQDEIVILSFKNGKVGDDGKADIEFPIIQATIGAEEVAYLFGVLSKAMTPDRVVAKILVDGKPVQ